MTFGILYFLRKDSAPKIRLQFAVGPGEGPSLRAHSAPRSRHHHQLEERNHHEQHKEIGARGFAYRTPSQRRADCAWQQKARGARAAGLKELVEMRSPAGPQRPAGFRNRKGSLGNEPFPIAHSTNGGSVGAAYLSVSRSWRASANVKFDSVGREKSHEGTDDRTLLRSRAPINLWRTQRSRDTSPPSGRSQSRRCSFSGALRGEACRAIFDPSGNRRCKSNRDRSLQS